MIHCHRLNFYLIASLLAIAAPTIGHAQEVNDPRPKLLILGDAHSLPSGLDPSWVELLQNNQPDWNILLDAKPDRTLASAAQELPGILEKHKPLDGLLIFLSRDDARPDIYSQGGKEAAVEHLNKILDSAKTSATKIAYVTPLPIIDARLDKWGKDKWTGGEANMAALAPALLAAATAKGVPVIDLFQAAYGESDQAGPATILGSTGFTIKGWAHKPLFRMISSDLPSKLPLTPRNPDALKKWISAREDLLKLDAILASTGEGTVRHGPKIDPSNIPLPLLQGSTLDILLTADDKSHASLAPGKENKTPPTLTAITDDGSTIRIASPPTQWQVISEEKPHDAIPADRFRFNAGKMRYFAVASNEPGKRLWVLFRFPLEELKGKTIKSASIQFQPAMGVEGIDSNLFGSAALYPVLGRDQLWSSNTATWATRDGKNRWTGGQPNKDARRKAIQEFLSTNPSPSAVEAAKTALSEIE